jgi:hypothetical protein
MKTTISSRRFLTLLATAAIGLALCSRVLADDHKKKPPRLPSRDLVFTDLAQQRELSTRVR